MKDNQIYNVIVVKNDKIMGELVVIAENDNDCLETVKKTGYQVLSYNNLETFKEKVKLMEEAKIGKTPSLKSSKMKTNRL